MKWLIAKFVPNVRRHEPRNVGVILFKDGKPYSRFMGMNSDGVIDGRKTKFTQSSDNYKAWVSYWNHAAEGGDIATLMGNNDPGASFFLEIGGERVVGAEMTDPEAFRDDLFRNLVVPDEPRN